MIQIDPLDFNSNFECLSCKSKESSDRIETLVQDYSGKGLSINDVTQSGQFLTPFPNRPPFYFKGLRTIVTKSLTPSPTLKTVTSCMDEEKSSELKFKRFESDFC